MPTPKILRVVCRGTVVLDAKNNYFKVIVPYIESLSRLGAIPQCNPTTLSTRNLDRLKASFEEDIASDLNDVDSRRCRLQLEVLYTLYRGLELFELQGGKVAAKFLSDVVVGRQSKADVRFELLQNENFNNLRNEIANLETNSNALNDSTVESKILKLADILEKYFRRNATEAPRILVAVPTLAVCEEVNIMLAGLSNFVTSYVYDPSKYSKVTHKDFNESSDNCIVVISSEENLKGQHISLVGISLAICLDVPKSVFRRPPRWQGSIYMLLTDVENKSFQGDSILATSPRKPPATLKRGFANQKSRGKKAFLNKEEQNEFERHFKSSTKIILPSYKPDAPLKSQTTSSVCLSLSNWRQWQSRLQETYQVGHSADTELLVDVFALCDDTADLSRLESYENEMAAHFCPSDVYLCDNKPADSASDIINEEIIADSFDIEHINTLAISSEVDRYVLDSAEKIAAYFLELELSDRDGAFPEQENCPNVNGFSLCGFQEEAEDIPDIVCLDASPENEEKQQVFDRFITSKSSPLRVIGNLPMSSTPSSGSRAPEANFEMTPITNKQLGAFTSKIRNTPGKFESSSQEPSRLGLTALVDVVQRRKKQKNLQYFFSNKMNQQTQLSAIAEVVKDASVEEVQETTLRTNEISGIKQHTSHKTKIELNSGLAMVTDANVISKLEKSNDRSNNDSLSNIKLVEVKTETSQEKRNSSQTPKSTADRDKNYIEIIDDDDDAIFDEIEIDGPPPAKKTGFSESSASYEKPSKDVKQTEEKLTGTDAGKASNSKTTTVELKPKPRSVFAAFGDAAKPADCRSAHNAVLDIINNIPTRSRETVEAIQQPGKPAEVGNIFTAEFHEEIKCSSHSDSDDLFDLVEEPPIPKTNSSQPDIVLEELLKKADERHQRNLSPAQGSAKAVWAKKETVLPKRFQKQELKHVVDAEDILKPETRTGSSVASLSQPSTSAATHGSRGAIFENRQSKSQQEHTAKNLQSVSTEEKNVSTLENGSSKMRKRIRSSSGSSDELVVNRRRKKKPPSCDPVMRLKKKIRNEYFDGEAEVDSLESVTEDEDDHEDAYEMNSFVDDEEPILQSQGMYHRINKHLSPPRKYRKPSKLVPYEECFSQEPSDEDDTYDEGDSFVAKEPVSEVSLPAEITIIQEMPKPRKKNTKKATRRAFICDDSSEHDHVSDEANKSAENLTQFSEKTAKTKNTKVSPKNVILVNTALLGVLPEILVGLQRTFAASHIEPVDMVELGNHPVDLYLGNLCVKFVTLAQLGSMEAEVRAQLRRLRCVCEKPVLVLVTSTKNQSASERLFKAIVELSDLNFRTFFVNNQVELLMLLKCLSKQLLENEWLVQFLESDELSRLLKIPQLNILTASALLKEKGGLAKKVIQTSSVAEVETICSVSEEFAKTMCAAFRSC